MTIHTELISAILNENNDINYHDLISSFRRGDICTCACVYNVHVVSANSILWKEGERRWGCILSRTIGAIQAKGEMRVKDKKVGRSILLPIALRGYKVNYSGPKQKSRKDN